LLSVAQLRAGRHLAAPTAVTQSDFPTHQSAQILPHVRDRLQHK